MTTSLFTGSMPQAVPSGPSVTGAFPLETVILFVAVVTLSVVLDLVQHRGGKDVTVRNAAWWSVFWILTSFGFMGWLEWRHGAEHPEWPSLFLTGYILEKTLSVDNLMVFIAIFRYFRIKSGLQHRILYYGILGAVVFRGIFVGLGTGLLVLMGPWAEVIFGAFVAWAAVQMLRGGDNDGDGEPDYEGMPLVRAFKRIFPVFPKLVGERFFVNREEVAEADPSFTVSSSVRYWMTPAFVCLLVVEGSDVMFAFDSVPAVIAVTKEPLIVYAAMLFAVLGLRSLYFIVEALTRYLVHLEKAVVCVLFFISGKMLLSAAEHLTGLRLPWWSSLSAGTQANYSMYLVLGVLVVGVLASYVWPESKPAAEAQ